MIRLATFRVVGFQSYETTQEVNFLPDVTLLAGRNNVGKSALLRALMVPVLAEPGIQSGFKATYTWIITTGELAELLRSAGLPHLTSISGQLHDDISYRINADVKFGYEQSEIVDEVGPGGLDNAPYVGSPSLHIMRIDLSQIGIELHSIRQSGNIGSRFLSWNPPLTGTDASVASAANALVSKAKTALTSRYYVQPRRSTKPTQFRNAYELMADGENLTNVVATLFMNRRHDLFAELEDFMRDVFPEIRYLEANTEGDPPLARIKLTFGRLGGLSVPLEQCGTGIEQALMLATAILTGPNDRLILIDEPHAFLHPHAERGVLRFIRRHSEHQYVIATHSSTFLTAFPISQARLVTIDDDGSHISDVSDVSDILGEVGVTAADLWSADSILWVEGPTEKGILETIGDLHGLPSPVSVREMPDSLRDSAKSANRARQAIEFCRAVSQAIVPVQVAMLFLFDNDERRTDFTERVSSATSGRARFLPVREVENLLLDPVVIHEDLLALCKTYSLPEPTLQEVEAEFARLVADTSDAKLYPVADSQPDSNRIVGSELLQRLYWKWALSNYDKVTDGIRLARKVKNSSPDRLEPLLSVVRELGASRRGSQPSG